MADKDSTERNVFAEKIPNATLMICLFHTLRTFCHWKVGITVAQRFTLLEILSRLVYTRNEDYLNVTSSWTTLSLTGWFNTVMTIAMNSKSSGWKCLIVTLAIISTAPITGWKALTEDIRCCDKAFFTVELFQEWMKCLALERDYHAAMVLEIYPVNLN